MGVNRPAERLGPLASLNCDGRRGIWLLLGCALLLLPELAGDGARVALRYERDALANGELWRLLTAHVVHLNLQHAVLNTAGFVLMWALFAGDYTWRQWGLIVAGSLGVIDAGLWLRDSTVAWYVGSSGVLHGILAAGTLAWIRQRKTGRWILLAVVIGKLGYEQWTGASPFLVANTVVVNSHLYGALGGAVVASCLQLHRGE